MPSNSTRFSALSKPTPGDPMRPVLEMSFRGHRRDICCSAFEPSSFSGSAVPPRLLTAGADGAVILWDPRPTNRALRFVGHRSPVLGCDYCPKSVGGRSVTLLASCGMDGYARLWVSNLRRTSIGYPANYLVPSSPDTRGGGKGESNGILWRAHTGAAQAIKFAQDGSNTLYTAGADKAVKAWDLTYLSTPSHYSGGEPIVTFHGSRFLGSFKGANAAALWGGSEGTARGSLPHHRTTAANAHTNWVRCLAVQRASLNFSHYLASGGDDRVVMVWDTRSPHAGPAHAFYEHQASLRGLTFHANGFHLASCDANGVINLFDMRRSSSSALPPSASSTPQRYGLLQHYADAHGAGGVAVNEVCFAPSSSSAYHASSWLLSAGDDGTAKLWDTAEGFLYCTVQAHSGPVRTVSFTNDGSFFVTAGSDGVAMVWRCGLTEVTPEPPQRWEDDCPPSDSVTAGTFAAPMSAYQAGRCYREIERPESAAVPAGGRVDKEEEAAAAHPPGAAAPTRHKTRAVRQHVDPSYVAWQRRHIPVSEDTGTGKQARPAPTPSPSPDVASGNPPKPQRSSGTSNGNGNGRPPLPPASSPQSRHLPEDEDGSEAARERCSERGKGRHSHISHPQTESKASEAQHQQQQHQQQQPPPPPPPSSSSMAIPPLPAAVQRGTHRIDELAERRLENVESAVASMVEYVQEESSHRDAELRQLREEDDHQRAKQREEMLALRSMMERLLAQQTALLGRLGTDTEAAAKAIVDS